MKDLMYTILVVLLIVVGALYFLRDSPDQVVVATNTDPQNTTYTISDIPVTLINGSAESDIVSGSSSKIVTKYFGNEVRSDLNDDGREDSVFLLTQNTGGSGTFYYVVAAINTENGWQGSHALLLGDRIAPQSTSLSANPSHKNVIVVNYADRNPNEPMTAEPTVGKSIWIKLDPQSMYFGEVVQDFEGEADPNIMSLDMKTWQWIRTTYNNDTELIPEIIQAFTITFKNDGTFSATTDCNAMNGTYEVNNNQITFGENIAMTKMFCENSQEQEFASMLGEIHSFLFTSKAELVFELKFDSGSAIFK